MIHTNPPADIPDYTNLTCTSLMIRLKQQLKKLPEGKSFTCIVRRDQRDTVEVPFSRTGYNVTVSHGGKNRYIVTLTKNHTGDRSNAG